MQRRTHRLRWHVLGTKAVHTERLRHFYASWLINSKEHGGRGLPPKVVQEWLGHSTLAMTMDTYGHLFPTDTPPEELRAAELALLE